MKTTHFTLLLAAVITVGASSAISAEKKASNVTVSFHESDKFTDAGSSMGGGTDTYYLELLQQHLQESAGRRLAPGQKLEVTITDVDLAGDFVPGRSASDNDIRIVREIYIPRITLSFRLLDAEGQVVKEGQRKLSDMNFMNNIGIIGRNEPLFYDKALLTDWLTKEFKS